MANLIFSSMCWFLLHGSDGVKCCENTAIKCACIIHNFPTFAVLILFQALIVGVIVVDCQQVVVVFHKFFVPKGEVHVAFV